MITNVHDELGSHGGMQQLIRSLEDTYTKEEAPKRIFDTVIIDNAQMLPEIETCLILNELRPNKLVLIGDQNSPRASSTRFSMPFSQELNYNRSSFERLV